MFSPTIILNESDQIIQSLEDQLSVNSVVWQSLSYDSLESIFDHLDAKTSNTLKIHGEMLCDDWNDALERVGSNKSYREIKSERNKSWLRITNGRMSSAYSKVWDLMMSKAYRLDSCDSRGHVRKTRGLIGVWYSENDGYFSIASSNGLQSHLEKQPSIHQWKPLTGTVSYDLILALVDVDWVRMSQLSGNLCFEFLARKWLKSK